MKQNKYKPGDVVKIKCLAGSAIPNIHVELIEKHTTKERKYNKTAYQGFSGWDAKLIYEKEVEMLRKRFQIPFKYPNNIETFVFESEIICKVN